ncbi:MAG: phage portal protein [Rhizobiales bacterium]|nr:phage portal protein [Hyphomicrobiales bacterium]
MALLDSIRGWFGRAGAMGERAGAQASIPSMALVPDTANIGADAALQISTVWACVERRASIIASLPLFAYTQAGNGMKELARASSLYGLLHNSPNARMTPYEFWRAMVMNHDLRGNAYARIERNAAGEATALWPMPADQVTPIVLNDGAMVYQYQIDSDLAIIAAANVLHLKGLGNGTTGLSKLEFMRATTDETAKAQTSAAKIFGSSGKPTGVLMIDRVLKPEQREALQLRFAEMASGNTARLYVLEADMKYQQLSISPEDQQLLETRRFSVEEICRWFDVPPVLVHHANVTTWGSGIEQIVAGFHKFTVRPMLVSIEQAVTKRVMTSQQRATMSVEFNFEALLRGDPAARAQFYATGLQNGYITRNEVRQLENLPRDASPQADALTAQTNLVPLAQLGKASEPVADTDPQSLAAAVAMTINKAAQEDGAQRRHAEIVAALRDANNRPAAPAAAAVSRHSPAHALGAAPC